MTALHVGILGCGGIAARHAGAIAALPDLVTLVACCGRDATKTAAFAAQHGGRAFTDIDGMIDAGVDMVVVTIPPFARNGEVEHIASRGVHLLVEKPIALDMAAATRMADAVEASGVLAAIGFMYRFGDAVRRWRSLDTGAVGLYAGSYHCNALHADWWRTRAKSGGQIVEQVIHQIDLIRYLIGEPDTVYARMANLNHGDTPGYDVEDVSAIVFGWNDGRIATLNASNIAVPGLWYKDWNIFAERVTGRFTSWNDAVLTRTDGSGESETIVGPTDPFVAQIADVASSIRDRRSPHIPLREGVDTLRLALASARSATEGREIALTDV